MSLTGNYHQDVNLKDALEDLQSRAYHTSASSGFHDDDEPKDALTKPLRAQISQRLMLIVSEAAEAMEEVREVDTMEQLVESTADDNGKVLGFGSELADIIIRVWDLAGSLDIDLATITLEKMTFNAKRTRMHGKKF